VGLPRLLVRFRRWFVGVPVVEFGVAFELGAVVAVVPGGSCSQAEPRASGGDYAGVVSSDDEQDVVLTVEAAVARAEAVPPRLIFTVDEGALARGFLEAVGRFQQAAVSADADAIGTFIPLFEALNWAVSYSDLLREAGRRPDDPILRGICHARNRVHHQWAGAMQLRTRQVGVVRAQQGTSRIIRALASEWEWRPLDNLPAPPRKHADPRGAIAYREQLAGRPVRTTLEQLARVFEQA
jgi:hypothetical protein